MKEQIIQAIEAAFVNTPAPSKSVLIKAINSTGYSLETEKIKKITEAIKSLGGSATTSEIMKSTGFSRSTVRTYIKKTGAEKTTSEKEVVVTIKESRYSL